MIKNNLSISPANSEHLPELELVLQKMTPDTLRNYIGQMLDCMILQRKPEGGLDIYWIGPGHIAQTDEIAGCLGALQSAIHFSQLHLTGDGSAVATATLKPHPNRQCPFTGGCAAEKADNFPEACKKSPWERFILSPPGDKVCWYAAGVRALRYPTPR